MQEVIRHLNHTRMHLARAARQVEKLPHSERRALMYSMICNQGKVLTLILALAKQEDDERAGKEE